MVAYSASPIDIGAFPSPGQQGPGLAIQASALQVGAGPNNQVLTAQAGRFTYISGFAITGLGATAGSTIDVTVTGVIGGPLHFALTIPAGATVAITPLIINFTPPLPSNVVNAAITLNVPSFGAGNVNNTATAWGLTL